MHGGSSSGGRKKARIEIIPLIDVIFFLLATFIMVSLSMTKNQGIQVALPAGGGVPAAGEQKDVEKPLSLNVTQKGEVLVNGKDTITMAQVPVKLQSYKSTAKDPRVVVSGEAGTNFKNVIAVMDEARKAGIAKVAINTDKR